MNPKKPIGTLILNIRNQKVILDADLAELYGMLTKVFNQAFNRNRRRFPDDFAFQFTAAEFAALRIPDSSQIAVSSTQVAENKRVVPNWSQFVTSSKRHTSLVLRSQIVTLNNFTNHPTIGSQRSRLSR